MIGSDYMDGILLESESDEEARIFPELEAMLLRRGVLHVRLSNSSLKILCTGKLKEQIKGLDCWEFKEWRKDNPIE
jgi:hypothetical protein